MSGFIKLTRGREDPPIYVNVDQILYFEDDREGHADVLMSDGCFLFVEESPESIENLISLCRN